MSKFWAKEDDSSEDSSSSDDSSKSSSSSGSSVGGGGGAGGGGGRGKGETGGDNRWVMESDSGELIIFVHTSAFVTISSCCLRLMMLLYTHQRTHYLHRLGGIGPRRQVGQNPCLRGIRIDRQGITDGNAN